MKPNIYENTADFYDFGNARANVAIDVEFYKSLIPNGASILEIGCGTGRVSIELARSGYRVEGLDLSEPMLRVFQTKLRSEPHITIPLSCHDMRDFDLQRTFDWIIFPFRVFQALQNEKDREACLFSIGKHMTPESRAVICMFNPHPDVLKNWGKKGIVDFDVPYKETNKNIRRISNQIEHDPIRQTIEVEMFIEKHHDGQIEERYEDRIVLGYLFPEQSKALFEKSGFLIEEEFAGYDKSRMEPGIFKEQIYVLKKK